MISIFRFSKFYLEFIGKHVCHSPSKVLVGITWINSNRKYTIREYWPQYVHDQSNYFEKINPNFSLSTYTLTVHKTNKNNTENSFHEIEVDINHLFWPFFPFQLHSNENQCFLLNLGENEIRNETKPNHNLRQFSEREGALGWSRFWFTWGWQTFGSWLAGFQEKLNHRYVLLYGFSLSLLISCFM